MIIDKKSFDGSCTCGRTHAMETEFAVMEPGCLFKFHEYLEQFGVAGPIVAVYDSNTYQVTADRRPAADYEVILDPNDLHANEHGVDLLKSQLPGSYQTLVAIGSGTIHDITRYCAWEAGVPFVSCPTAASVDGFCSSAAAMTWKGCKKTLTCIAPRLVIADIDIIRNAPIHLAKSGFGDMVGKYIALADWKMAHILTGEYHCQRIASLMAEATRMVMDVDGLLTRDPDAYTKLVYGLLLSGIAMQMLGNSRPASGAEHHISHMIEMQPQGLGIASDALHGEKVGVGTLMVSREYHRLKNLKGISFEDYLGVPEEIYRAVFGPALLEGIISENQKNCAAGVTGVQIQKHWEAMCREIETIPQPEALKEMYQKLGVKADLEDIGVDSRAAVQIMKYSPYVRNRLTLMRLRVCIREGGAS